MLGHHIDVVVHCSSKDTYEACKSFLCKEPAYAGSPEVMFGREVFHFGLDIADASVIGRKLSLLLANSGDDLAGVMAISAQLVASVQPWIICTLGTCIAKPSSMAPGDVLLAKSIWSHQLPECLDGDIQMVPQKLFWLQEMQAFVRAGSLLLHRASPNVPTDGLRHSPAIHIADLASHRMEDAATTGAEWFKVLTDIKPGTLAVDAAGIAIALVANNFSKHWLAVKTATSDAGGAWRAEESAVISSLLVLTQLLATAFERFRTDFVRPACHIAYALPDDQRSSTPRDQSVLAPLQMQLRKKLSQDFALATISRPDALSSFAAHATNQMTAAGLVRDHADTRLANVSELSGISPLAWKGEASSAATKAASEAGEIHVACSAIYPAAIAVLTSIANRLLPQLHVHVDQINSIELISLLKSQADYDFAFAAEDPFFLTGDRASFRFRRLFPCQRAPQWAIRNAKHSMPEAGTVYIVPGSSGASQYLGRINVGEAFLSHEIDAGDIYTRALNLEEGELMLVWSPIVDWLSTEASVVKVEHSRYDIFVSLFANAPKWFAGPAAAKAMCGFVELFIAEWIRCSRDVSYCVSLLEQDRRFIDLFQHGCGAVD